MKEYLFDNLIPFLKATSRLKTGWYRAGQGKDVDEMVVFTTGKAAKQEGQHNLDVMLERSREMGVEYLIFGYNGVQILTNQDSLKTKDAGEYILKEFRDKLNNIKDENGYGSYHLYSPTTETGTAGYSFYQIYTYYGKEMTLKNHLGFYEVATGKKITKRDTILKLLWDMGFLAERRRILYAASLNQGSPDEVRMYNEMEPKIKTLPRGSYLKVNFYTAWRKMNRLCDYPGFK